MADQPSKESLERARAFFIGFFGNGADKQYRHGVDVLALEFDAIRLRSYEIGKSHQRCDDADWHQQNAALVSALRELEQRWRGLAAMADQTARTMEGNAERFPAFLGHAQPYRDLAKFYVERADDLKEALVPYAPAEEKEKP